MLHTQASFITILHSLPHLINEIFENFVVVVFLKEISGAALFDAFRLRSMTRRGAGAGLARQTTIGVGTATSVSRALRRRTLVKAI